MAEADGDRWHDRDRPLLLDSIDTLCCRVHSARFRTSSSNVVFSSFCFCEVCRGPPHACRDGSFQRDQRPLLDPVAHSSCLVTGVTDSQEAWSAGDISHRFYVRSSFILFCQVRVADQTIALVSPVSSLWVPGSTNIETRMIAAVLFRHVSPRMLSFLIERISCLLFPR